LILQKSSRRNHRPIRKSNHKKSQLKIRFRTKSLQSSRFKKKLKRCLLLKKLLRQKRASLCELNRQKMKSLVKRKRKERKLKKRRKKKKLNLQVQTQRKRPKLSY